MTTYLTQVLMFRVNMYTEGLMDQMEMIMILPFQPDAQTKLANIQSKAKDRYMPVFEKALSSCDFLVGGRLTCADVMLMECSLMLEEKFPDVLAGFPKVKAFQTRMGKHPAIVKFLQPGSKRKPQPDDVYLTTVKKVLAF